jgi:hypothetical protein
LPLSSDRRVCSSTAARSLAALRRRHGHGADLDVGARLISVDLQEHVTDAKRRALVMGDDDLDLLHVAIVAGMPPAFPTGCVVPRHLRGNGEDARARRAGAPGPPAVGEQSAATNRDPGRSRPTACSSGRSACSQRVRGSVPNPMLELHLDQRSDDPHATDQPRGADPASVLAQPGRRRSAVSERAAVDEHTRLSEESGQRGRGDRRGPARPR